MNELSGFLFWNGAMILMSLIGLPLAQFFFKDWRDKGYIFARYIGLFIVAMPLWFLSSLRIIQFTELSVIIFIVVGVAVSGYFIGKKKVTFTKGMVAQELMFFILFAVWTFIRSYNSDVFGTEKMMNLAFMNSINLTEYMPPADPWFTGGTINYYYLGHYMYVFLSKLIGLPIGIVYNLALTTIIAQLTVSVYAIIRKLTNKSQSFLADNAALLGAIFISFAGNLHYPFRFVEGILTGTSAAPGGFNSYYFPDPTRIIPNVIDEFPSYSIVLGDVHGHYISLPFFVLGIALIISSARYALDSKKKLQLTAIISFFVAALYGINSWDLITMVFLFTCLHLVQLYQMRENMHKAVINFVMLEFALLVPGLIFMLPYMLNFVPAVGGLGLVSLDLRSPVVPWVMMWGFFLLGSLVYAAYVVAKKRDLVQGGLFVTVVTVTLLLFGVEYHLLGYDSEAPEYATSVLYQNGLWLLGWAIVQLSAFFGFGYLLFKKFANKKTQFIAPMLIVAAFCLIIGVEFLFFKDIFADSNPPYFRTNTVFKFYYHAWILWGIGLSWLLYRLTKAQWEGVVKKDTALNRLKFAGVGIFTVVLLLLPVTYIIKAVGDFYPIDAEYPVTRSIDGTVWLWEPITDGGHPADAALIKWMQENIDGQPVIIEAVGEAYTYASRITTHTGFITPVGWPTHEWQWRADATEPYARADDVRAIYEAVSAAELRTLVDKYDAEYIVIGEEERTKYNTINLDLLLSEYETVFSVSDTYLLKVR